MGEKSFGFVPKMDKSRKESEKTSEKGLLGAQGRTEVEGGNSSKVVVPKGTKTGPSINNEKKEKVKSLQKIPGIRPKSNRKKRGVQPQHPKFRSSTVLRNKARRQGSGKGWKVN